MKKLIALILATLLLISLAACGATSGTEAEKGGVQVDEGLLTVDVTLGANFFEDKTPEEIKAEAKENGYLDCTVAEDGTVTYKMTKKQHKEQLEEFKITLNESFANLLEGDDKVESFVSIDSNDDFSKIDIYVDPDLYTTWDNMYALAFYISGAYYQAFAGVEVDNIDVVVNFIDNNTKEVLNTASYKEFRQNATGSTEA